MAINPFSNLFGASALDEASAQQYSMLGTDEPSLGQMAATSVPMDTGFQPIVFGENGGSVVIDPTNPTMQANNRGVDNSESMLLGGLGLGGAAFAAQTGRLPSPQIPGPPSSLAQRVAANDAARRSAARQAAAAARPIGSNLPANPASSAVGPSGGTRLPSNPSLVTARQAAMTSAQRAAPSLATRALPLLGQAGSAFAGGYALGTGVDQMLGISDELAKAIIPDNPREPGRRSGLSTRPEPEESDLQARRGTTRTLDFQFPIGVEEGTGVGRGSGDSFVLRPIATERINAEREANNQPAFDFGQMTGMGTTQDMIRGVQEMTKPTSPGFDITFERDGRTFAIPEGGSVQDAFVPTAAQLQQFDAFQKAQPGFQSFQGGAATGPATPAPAGMQRTIDPRTGDIIFADPTTAGQFSQQILAQRQREQELTPGVMTNLQQGAAALRGTAGQPMTQAQLDAASQARTDRVEEARQQRIQQGGATATTELPSSIVSILNTPQSQQTQKQRDRLSRFARNKGTTIGALKESQRGPLETARDVSALDSAALQREATELNMLAQRGNILGAEQRRRLGELEIEKIQRELDNPTVDSPSVAETKALLEQYGVARMKDVRLKDANTLKIGNTTIKMNTPEGQQALQILRLTNAGRAILQALTTPEPNVMQGFNITGRSGAGISQSRLGI